MIERAPLRLAVAQPVIESHDVAANAVAHASAVAEAAARVVVFPELSLTGYELEASPVRLDDRRLEPLIEACGRHGSLALVGAPTVVAGGRQLSMLAIDGTGVRVAYHKMWLGEDEVGHFIPGEAPALIEVDGWRLGLAICRDTGVASHADEVAALGADVYVAGVLEHEADRDVQPARAARIFAAHGMWVAVASFAGSTGGGFDLAAGRSAVWAPDGRLLAVAGTEPGEVVGAVLTDGA